MLPRGHGCGICRSRSAISHAGPRPGTIRAEAFGKRIERAACVPPLPRTVRSAKATVRSPTAPSTACRLTPLQFQENHGAQESPMASLVLGLRLLHNARSQDPFRPDVRAERPTPPKESLVVQSVAARVQTPRRNEAVEDVCNRHAGNWVGIVDPVTVLLRIPPSIRSHRAVRRNDSRGGPICPAGIGLGQPDAAEI